MNSTSVCLLASEQSISLSPSQWTAHHFVSWPDSAQKQDPNRLWTLYFYIKSALDGMRSLPVVLLAFLVVDNRQLVTELFISMTAMTKLTWRRCSSQDVASCSSCHFLPLSCTHLSRPRCCWTCELFVTLCWQPKHKHSQLHINRANTRYLRNRMSKDSTPDPMNSRAVSAWRHLSRRIQALRFVVAVEPYLFINSAINTRQIACVHQNKLSYLFFFFFFLFLFYCWQRGALLYFR